MTESRGQTQLDFGLGMGVFLLAVAFTFGTMPTLLDPMVVTVDDDATAHSERVNGVVVSELTGPGGTTASNATVDSFFNTTASNSSKLREFVGLSDRYHVNVSIWNRTGTQLHATGDPYDSGSDGVTTTRIISVTNETCDPTCRVVVHVW
jgi:hypothetical protein